MAEYGNQEAWTLKAAADLSATQFHIMKISDGNQKVNIGTAASQSAIIGVLQNKPAAAGRHATVAYSGVSKLTVGAAVNSVGVFLTCNGSGRAIAAASGDICIGRSLTTGSANGDIITALLHVPFRLSGAI